MVGAAPELVEVVQVQHHRLARAGGQEGGYLSKDIARGRTQHAVRKMEFRSPPHQPKVEVPSPGRQLGPHIAALRLAPARDQAADGGGGPRRGAVKAHKRARQGGGRHVAAAEAVGARVVRPGQAQALQRAVRDGVAQSGHPRGAVQAGALSPRQRRLRRLRLRRGRGGARV